MNIAVETYAASSRRAALSAHKLQIVAAAAPVNLENVQDFSNVCRLCATITELVIPIFEGEGLENNLAEKISEHLPIKVGKQDALPLVVCYQCASTLLAWHELVQCSVQADAALRQRLAVDTLEPKPSSNTSETSEKSSQTNQHLHLNLIEVKVESQELVMEVKKEEIQEKETEETKPCVVTNENGKRYVFCGICKKNVFTGSWRRHERAHRGDRRFSCHTCGLVFNDSSNLARHTRALHAKHRPHVCHICHKSFSRNCHLQDHFQSHSENRGFVCELCGKASKSSAALRMHRRTHEDVGRFQCMECGSKFKRKSELKAHVTVHTGEKAFLCGCGRAFRLRNQLTAHARTHDKQKRNSKTVRSTKSGEDPPSARPRRVDAATSPAPTVLTRTCDFCSLEFQKRGYNDHLLNAHPDQVFRCDECHSYVDKKELLYHMSDHAYQYVVIKNGIKKDRKNTRKLLIIDDQNKQSQATTSQSSDKKTVTKKEKPVENEFSDHSDGECFGSLPPSVLEAIHDSLDSPSCSDNEDSLPMNTEKDTDPTSKNNDANDKSDREEIEDTLKKKEDANEELGGKSKKSKIRTCPICSKEYRASSSYFYHMKYFHKRSREHACDVCGRKFGTKANLAQHASIHTGECALECKTCKKKFRSKASLYIHEQTHTGVKTFACTECSMSFRWRTHLVRHAKRHAGVRAHVCAQCGRGFSVRGDLVRHARTHRALRLRCQHCSGDFAQPRYLKVHMMKKHSADVQPTQKKAAA